MKDDEVWIHSLDDLFRAATADTVDDLTAWLWTYGGYEFDVLMFPPDGDENLILGFGRSGVGFELPVTLADVLEALDDLHEELESLLDEADEEE